MLYLNPWLTFGDVAGEFHLTLTSVVFEYFTFSLNILVSIDLTLTSVVFECATVLGGVIPLYNLTLTSVVFE